MARLQPTAKLILHDMTVHTGFSVVRHVRITTSVHEGVGANTDREADGDAQDHTTCKPWFIHLLLFWVALDTLKHRDVSQVDGVFEWFVRLVAGLALPSCQSSKVNRMLKVDRLRTCRRPR